MSVNIKKHIGLLGYKVKDKVTGFKGVVSSIHFDLYGCIQAVVVPGADKTKLDNGHFFDVGRLEVTSKKPVMEIPDFDYGAIAEGKKGPAAKPPIVY